MNISKILLSSIVAVLMNISSNVLASGISENGNNDDGVYVSVLISNTNDPKPLSVKVTDSLTGEIIQEEFCDSCYVPDMQSKSLELNTSSDSYMIKCCLSELTFNPLHLVPQI